MIKIHFLYWSLIYLTGLMQLFQISSSVYKFGVPLILIILFVSSLKEKIRNYKLPHINYILLFLVFTVLSGIVNEQDLFSIIYFITYTVFSYFYFLIIINESDDGKVEKIKKIIIGFILLQIPASLLKYAVIGQSEKGGVGTMDIGAGSLSAIFPALIIAFLISYYLFTKKKIYLLLIFFFLLFGLIGDKRAIVFIIPLEILIGYFLYMKFSNFKIDIIKTFVGFPLLLFTLFYFSVRTSPTLNPENSNWGSFEMDYVMNYTTNYNQTSETNSEEISRQDGLIYFTEYILNSKYPQMLLGDGAGKLVDSQFKSKPATMLDLYGVRYGGRMGFIWILLQVGFLGAFFFLMPIYLINKNIIKYILKSPMNSSPLTLGFIIATIFMMFDTFIYSNSFVRYEAVKGVYFFIAAYIYRKMNQINIDQNIIS